MTEKLYAEVKPKRVYAEGVYEVVEIIGSIVAVNIEGTTIDFYLERGEIVKFCKNKEGNNFLKNFK